MNPSPEVETTNFVRGDKVVLVNNSGSCPFELGTVITIAEVFRSSSGRYARVSILEDLQGTYPAGVRPSRFRKVATRKVKAKEMENETR